MNLHIVDDGGYVTSLWVTNVPEDLTHEDVLWSFQMAAESGDRIAAKALPYLERCHMAINGGSRVYVDNA